MELAKENNWQRCSSCLYVVEKVDGCNHMVCRCGNQFWYVDQETAKRVNAYVYQATCAANAKDAGVTHVVLAMN